MPLARTYVGDLGDVAGDEAAAQFTQAEAQKILGNSDVGRRLAATAAKLAGVAEDATKGAAIGGAVGTAVPIIGNAVGGVVGTAVGYVYGIGDQFGDDIKSAPGDVIDAIGSLFGGKKPPHHEFDTSHLPQLVKDGQAIYGGWYEGPPQKPGIYLQETDTKEGQRLYFPAPLAPLMRPVQPYGVGQEPDPAAELAAYLGLQKLVIDPLIQAATADLRKPTANQYGKDLWVKQITSAWAATYTRTGQDKFAPLNTTAYAAGLQKLLPAVKAAPKVNISKQSEAFYNVVQRVVAKRAQKPVLLASKMRADGTVPPPVTVPVDELQSAHNLVSAAAAGDQASQAAVGAIAVGAEQGAPGAVRAATILDHAQKLMRRAFYVQKWLYGGAQVAVNVGAAPASGGRSSVGAWRVGAAPPGRGYSQVPRRAGGEAWEILP